MIAELGVLAAEMWQVRSGLARLLCSGGPHVVRIDISPHQLRAAARIRGHPTHRKDRIFGGPSICGKQSDGYDRVVDDFFGSLASLCLLTFGLVLPGSGGLKEHFEIDR